MKTFTTIKVISTLMLAVSATAFAQAPEDAPAEQRLQQKEQQQEQQQERRDYERALESARKEQEAARLALAKAREELDQREELLERDRAGNEELRQRAEQERERMREELSRVHENLRQASREVALVHRELDRAETDRAFTLIDINLGDKAVIGVVLGDSNAKGVPVLGVSPDGPADRAGIKQGDVIISMMGKALADDHSEDARAVLHDVMEGVKAGDELLLAVDRGGKQFEYTVIPEKREPLAWQSIVRLPSAPHAPSAPHTPSAVRAPGVPRVFEHIEIPEISGEALESQIARIRKDVDRARVVIETTRSGDPGEAPQTWEYRFDSLSELGGDALHETNVWFGLPATRGLQFAEIDAGLGSYFKTDRGVLVVKANDSNDLKLVSGDVILKVGDQEVNKPADVMRALRAWDSSEAIKIDIKRERKNQTLNVVLPERKLGFNFIPFDQPWEFSFQTGED